MQPEFIQDIIKKALGQPAKRFTRFPTGLSHFVYDVLTQNGLACVIRIAVPERAGELREGLHWHKQLSKLAVPLPQILAAGEHEYHLFAIYERLPGNDLEVVYPTLTAREKQNIAYEVARIQQVVQQVNLERWKTAVSPWTAVLNTIINRTQRELATTGTGNMRYVELVRTQMRRHHTYLTNVRPIPFLYDLNVRNVMVHQGEVSSIIDVDELWLGDPLLAIGRGKTLLLMMRQEPSFITHWCNFLQLSDQQRQIVDFYALLYCLRFMGTSGLTLNGNPSLQTDPTILAHLEKIADDLRF